MDCLQRALGLGLSLVFPSFKEKVSGLKKELPALKFLDSVMVPALHRY